MLVYSLNHFFAPIYPFIYLFFLAKLGFESGTVTDMEVRASTSSRSSSRRGSVSSDRRGSVTSDRRGSVTSDRRDSASCERRGSTSSRKY
eukprot:Awhi_evm2s4389